MELLPLKLNLSKNDQHLALMKDNESTDCQDWLLRNSKWLSNSRRVKSSLIFFKTLFCTSSIKSKFDSLKEQNEEQRSKQVNNTFIFDYVILTWLINCSKRVLRVKKKKTFKMCSHPVNYFQSYINMLTLRKNTGKFLIPESKPYLIVIVLCLICFTR